MAIFMPNIFGCPFKDSLKPCHIYIRIMLPAQALDFFNSLNFQVALQTEQTSPWKFKHLSIQSLREKCPHLEFFWSLFSRIWTEYGEIGSISPYSVRMWGNADQENSEYGHFPRSLLKHVEFTNLYCVMSTNQTLFARFLRIFQQQF